MSNHKERTLARECIVKILYQHDMTEYNFKSINGGWTLLKRKTYKKRKKKKKKKRGKSKRKRSVKKYKYKY